MYKNIVMQQHTVQILTSSLEHIQILTTSDSGFYFFIERSFKATPQALYNTEKSMLAK